VIENIGDQSEDDDESGVFEVSNLDVHAPEFDSPANIGGDRWRGFESERVPISRLQVFEVSERGLIVDALF
jgi:hypothetical protein